MIAVLKTGGKQYSVTEGDEIVVEKIDANVGDSIELAEVLMTIDGEKVTVGRPLVDGKKVTAQIVRQARGPKIIIMKHRRRHDYRLKKGHRQDETTIKIVSIN
ncbi:MAG: 50S ribosomal protein L21 [Nitrospinae bacterium]|nr:50S ribosomal protein L21 [Nitrospinota bacterium]MBF0633136.1 50S ribosomal protein L21 [Nitrospinota bacterium]